MYRRASTEVLMNRANDSSPTTWEVSNHLRNSESSGDCNIPKIPPFQDTEKFGVIVQIVSGGFSELSQKTSLSFKPFWQRRPAPLQ